MNSTVYELIQEIHYKYNKLIVEMNLYFNEHKLRKDKISQDCNFLKQDNIILKQKPITFRFNYC